MKLNILLIVLIIAALVGFYACKKEHMPQDNMSNRTLVFIMPEGAEVQYGNIYKTR